MPIKTKKAKQGASVGKSSKQIPALTIQPKNTSILKRCTCNHTNYYRSNSGQPYPICDGKCDWS